MGYDVNLFFAPVDPDQTQWNVETAIDRVGDLIDKSRSETGLRSSVSRNGWHVETVRQAAAAHGSTALDFLEQPVACLTPSELAAAIRVLAIILAEAAGGVEELQTTCTAGANEFFLAQDRQTIDPDARSAYAQAFLEAKPAHEVEWSGDAGYSASVGYFAFLKSLMVGMTECLIVGKRLLVYRSDC